MNLEIISLRWLSVGGGGEQYGFLALCINPSFFTLAIFLFAPIFFLLYYCIVRVTPIQF